MKAEEVIIGLDCIKTHGCNGRSCHNCPYCYVDDCDVSIAVNAIKLLKEQKTIIDDLKTELEVAEANRQLLLIEKQEIVRCKDCKYGHYTTDSAFVFCTKPYVEVGSASHNKNWFCADGERNEK